MFHKPDPPAQLPGEYTCLKCYHKGPTKYVWKQKYKLWFRACEVCESCVFISGGKS